MHKSRNISNEIDAYLGEAATPPLEWKDTKKSTFGWSHRTASTAHGTFRHESHPLFGHFIRYQGKGSQIAPRVKVKNQAHADHLAQVHHWNAYRRPARVVTDRASPKYRPGVAHHEVGAGAPATGNVANKKVNTRRTYKTSTATPTKAPVGTFHAMPHASQSSEKDSVARAKAYLGKKAPTGWAKFRQKATAYLGKKSW